MNLLSTREAAKRLGISHAALARYIQAGKVPAPRAVRTGATTTHIWTEQEVEQVRKLLPKIANGRKTRWQRQREAQKKQTKSKRKK
jgi:excisionase family DNA binding protein